MIATPSGGSRMRSSLIGPFLAVEEAIYGAGAVSFSWCDFLNDRTHRATTDVYLDHFECPTVRRPHGVCGHSKIHRSKGVARLSRLLGRPRLHPAGSPRLLEISTKEAAIDRVVPSNALRKAHPPVRRRLIRSFNHRRPHPETV